MENFYPLLGINEEEGFVIYYNVDADVDITDISRAKYADEELENEGFNPHLMIIKQCITGTLMDLLRLRDWRLQRNIIMRCR